MSNDIAINPVGLSTKPTISNKPSYLVIFEDPSSSSGATRKIITIDKPDTGSSFLQMKGFFTEVAEEEILSSYQDILTTARKEDIIEIMIPWNRIFSVRSLVFKAK